MTQVFIYGGCVSRDTYRYLGDSFQLTRYVARQSAISAMSPAVRDILPRLAPLASAFQQRMVEWDLQSALVRHLTHDAANTDLLLVDLNVERLGVIPWRNGYVTRSNEHWNAGGAKVLRSSETIKLGTDLHFELWAASWARLATTLEELNLLHRTLLLETPWASLLSDGSELPPPSNHVSAAEANAAYEPYYAHLSSLGVPSTTLPASLAVSHQAHQWGPSPYHYVDEAYEWLAGEIRSAVHRLDVQEPSTREPEERLQTGVDVPDL